MNPQAFRALLWKEWREHRMRLVALCAVVAVWGVLQFPGGSSRSPRSVDSAFLVVLMISAVVMPIFVTMAIGTERASGSLDMLLHQPVPPALVLAVKTLMGAMTCLSPVLLTGLLAWLLIDPRQVPPSEIGSSTGIAVAGVITAYLWMISFSARASSETVVGVTCVALLICSGFVAGVGEDWLGERWLEDHPWRAGAGLAALTSVVWVVASVTFGVAPRRQWSTAVAVTPKKPVLLTVLPDTARALRWKERLTNSWWSITALLALVAVPGVVWLNTHWFDDDILPIFFLMAVFLAVLLPVTNLGRDMRPGVYEMLRATPMEPRHWFGVKYRQGLWAIGWPFAILLGLFGVLWFIKETAIPAWAAGVTTEELLKWFVNETFWHVVIVLMLSGSVVLLIYSVSFLLGCALRQPVYAGMLAMGFALMLITLPETYDLERALYRWSDGGDAVHGVPRSFTHPLWLVTSIVALALGFAAKRAAWWVVRTGWRVETR